MSLNQDFIREASALLGQEQFFVSEPMSKHTTFNIGGPADYLLFPANMEQLSQIFVLLKNYDIPHTILGNGSNVLVLDKGIRGAVIKMHAPMSYKRCEGNRIIAGAGAYLKHVSQFAAENGLTGMEFACGIPGSLGGAVFMNAGAYDGICQVLWCRSRLLPIMARFLPTRRMNWILATVTVSSSIMDRRFVRLLWNWLLVTRKLFRPR